MSTPRQKASSLRNRAKRCLMGCLANLTNLNPLTSTERRLINEACKTLKFVEKRWDGDFIKNKMDYEIKEIVKRGY